MNFWTKFQDFDHILVTVAVCAEYQNTEKKKKPDTVYCAF